MSDLYIEKLHTELVSIMDCIHELCLKNKIKYYLVGGSLLGAVRHHGFIPWDDDFDIGMPRKDFERFIDICEAQLPSNLKLLWSTTCHDYWYPFAKIHDTNTVFVEAKYSNLDEKTGIFVDVFPIDSVHEYNEKVERRKKQIAFISHIMSAKKRHVYEKTFKGRMRSLLAMTHSVERWHKIQTELMKKNNTEVSEFSANFASYYAIKKQVMPWRWYGNGTIVDFDGHAYVAPDESVEVLKKIYGDNYLELPPEYERRTHYPAYVKFKDGYECTFEETR